MSRNGELSGITNPTSHDHMMRTCRSSETFWRNGNRISMWDGRLEDTIASRRSLECKDYPKRINR